jgi:hypothetical protein
MAEPDDARDSVRASHPDREGTLAILHEALTQGRITASEYAERCETTLGAQTIGELRAVVADLPVTFSLAGDDQTVEWRGAFSSLKRAGAWEVPARIRLHRRMGSAELDFTEARFTSPTVEIELDVIGGSVELRLPESASVSIDDVRVLLGSVQDHRRAATKGGNPHIRLAGRLRVGSVEIRGPRRRMSG